MTRGTISFKRKDGGYCQLWYINSDGYLQILGKEIYKNLKTVEDIKQAVYIFIQEKCISRLETDFTLGETESIENILKQCNDYSYVMDEETLKWGFYMYNKPKLHDLEKELKEINEI